MSQKRKIELQARKKVLIDQLKIMDLYPQDALTHFGSTQEILRRINQILDEIINH
ncbi:MAG: hypothetical protein RLZZ292_3032 [Bacteroidota bacterium]|jgi:hypothetical protein